MSKFNPEKLSVEFNEDVNEFHPIIIRRYTLTHSDQTGNLFLTIGKEFDYKKITIMRDEVLGEWIKKGGKYLYNVYLQVNGEDGIISAPIRFEIFKRELPLALMAIRYGDNKFFLVHKELDTAPIIVYFKSKDPKYNTIENFGTFSDYTSSMPRIFLYTPGETKKLENLDKMFPINILHKKTLLLDLKTGDVNGDKIKDTVAIYGNKSGESENFIRDITIIIRDGLTGAIYSIPIKENDGYNPTIFLGDFTGDNVDDILISIDSGGSGAIGYFYIYSFLNNSCKKIFDFEEFNKIIYEVSYQDDFKVQVLCKTLNNKFILDIEYKGYEYLSKIYNKDGTLKSPIYGNVNPLSGLYPVDFERNGAYELLAFQRITGLYNADSLGFSQIFLKYNGKEFVPGLLEQLLGILGSDIE